MKKVLNWIYKIISGIICFGLDIISIVIFLSGTIIWGLSMIIKEPKVSSEFFKQVSQLLKKKEDGNGGTQTN